MFVIWHRGPRSMARRFVSWDKAPTPISVKLHSARFRLIRCGKCTAMACAREKGQVQGGRWSQASSCMKKPTRRFVLIVLTQLTFQVTNIHNMHIHTHVHRCTRTGIRHYMKHTECLSLDVLRSAGYSGERRHTTPWS